MSLKKICVIGVICGLIAVVCRAQSNTFFSEWRPNSDTGGIRFVGNKACIGCHPREAAQLTTPMAQALEVAPDCKIVSARRPLSFRNGKYTYEISRQGKDLTYKVSDGVNTIAKPILYCFGQGHVGQTYLFRYNDMLYETRVSYFQKLGKLDFTIGHRTNVPGSLEDALDALESDHEFLLKGGVFTEDLIETWIEYKRREEADAVRMRPHPWEFALYYDA